jgi:hypothetical protein
MARTKKDPALTTDSGNTAVLDPVVSLDELLDQQAAREAADRKAASVELWRLAEANFHAPDKVDGRIIIDMAGRAGIENVRGTWHDWCARARERASLRATAEAFTALDDKLGAAKLRLRAARENVLPMRKALAQAEAAYAAARGDGPREKAFAEIGTARENLTRALIEEETSTQSFLEIRGRWGAQTAVVERFRSLVPTEVAGALN